MKKLYLKAFVAVSCLMLGLMPMIGSAQYTITIGTDSILNTGTTYPAPYGNWYWGARHQMIILASTLTSMGVTPGEIIEGLSLEVETPEGTTLTDWTIKVGHTTAADLSGGWATGLTQVHYSPTYTDVAGWNMHLFQAPFCWNGTQNIVIETCFNNNGFTNNGIHRMSPAGAGATRYYRADAAGVCGNTALTATSANRPNMQLQINSPTGIDVGVTTASSPVSGCGLSATETVTVQLCNFCVNPTANFPVSYRVNGGAVTTQNFAATLPGFACAPFTFSTQANLAFPGGFTIEVWTAAATDFAAGNDTLSFFVQNDIPLTTFPYCEDFDTTASLLTQNTNDDFNWTLDANGTPSGATGPSSDHTLGAGNGGFYMYLETSTPRTVGQTAILTSPCLDISGLAIPWLEFWYNMNGATIGNLAVEIFSNNTWTQVWSYGQNDGDVWQHAKIDLTPYSGTIKYRFIGTVGTSFTGDMAIDDICVFDKPPFDDLAVTAFLNPLSGNRCDAASTVDTVSISIQNCGTSPFSNFNVHYSINGGAVVTQNVPGTVNPTFAIDFSFSTLANLNDTGTYTIVAWVDIPTDTVNNDSSSVTIVVNPDPTVNLGPNVQICTDGFATFDAGAGFAAYNWQSGAGFGQTFTVNQPGSYSVVVTDFNGCTATDAISVLVNPLPTLDLGPDTSICATDSLILDMGAGFTYSWGDGSTGQTLAVDVNTTMPCAYTLEIQDSFGDGWNGASLTIEANSVPVAGSPFTISGGSFGSFTFPVSDGDTLQLTHANGGFPGEEGYIIYNAQGDTVFADGFIVGAVAAAGVVMDSVVFCSIDDQVNVVGTITDGNGCSASDEILVYFIDTLVVDLGLDLTICDGDSVTWTIPIIGADSYVWSNGATGPSITTGIAGTYYVDVTKCGFATDTVILSVTPLPMVELGNDTILCYNDTLFLDAGAGPYTYGWSTGETTQNIQAQPGCDYVLDMFDSFGDGWNGGSLNFNVNGNLVGNYGFATGTFATATISGIAPGDIVTMDWIDGGFNNEVSWNLYDGSGELAQSISNPPLINTQGIFNAPATCGNEQTIYVTITDTITGCMNEDSIYVFFSNPAPSFGPDFEICSGDITTLYGMPAAAVAPLTYTWQDASTLDSLNTSVAGQYYLTVVDSIGCVGSDTVNIGVNPKPTVNASADTAICADGQAVLDAGAGFVSYAWNSGPTTQTLTTALAGQYIVEVTDTNNCNNFDTVMVSVNALPTVDLGPDTSICVPGTITFDAGTFASYFWSDSSTAQTVVVDSTATVSVEVTDANGCTATDDVDLLVIDSLVIDLGPDQTICEGFSVTLNAGIAGADSYSWSSAQTTQMITVTPSVTTDYIVTVAKCGATVSDTVTINVNPAPVANGGPDVTACFGDVVSHVATGGTSYLWYSVAGGVFIGFTDSIAGPVVANDTIVLTVTDGNGCVDVDSVYVTMNPLPVVNLGPDTCICAGDVLVLNAGPWVSYVWNNATTLQTRTVTSGGVYGVTVTDANGCQGSDSRSVCVNALPVANLGPDTTICDNANLVLDAGFGMSGYSWTGGSTNQTLVVPGVGGDYAVTITNPNGCMDSDTITVSTIVSPTVMLGNDSTLCIGDSVQANAGTGFTAYLWNTGETTQTIWIDSTMTATVTVTSANGCFASDSRFIQLVDSAVIVDLGPDLDLCPGDSVFVSSGIPGADSYAWSNGATTEGTWVSSTGDISVTVSVCGFSGADTLNVAPLPGISVNLGPDSAYCLPGAISWTLDAGPSFFYSWNGGTSSAQTYTVTGPGTYDVEITNINGCTATDEVTVTAFDSPIFDLGADQTVCEGSTVTLAPGTGNGWSYLWSDASTGSTLDVTTDATITLQISTANCGNANDAVTINFQAPPVVDLGADQEFCDGTGNYTLDLGANNYTTITWSDNSSGQTLNVTTTGTYYVAVVDSIGCGGSDTVEVSLGTAPVPNLGPDQDACVGDNVVLDAGAFVSYSWSNAATTQTTSVTTTNTYQVTVTNTDGCTGSSSVLVTFHALPVVALGADFNICDTDLPAVLDAGSGAGWTYAWDNGDMTQTSDINATGAYCVTVTDGNGCASSDCITVTVDDCPGIAKLYNNSSVSYYPNPTRSNLTLAIEGGINEEVIMTIVSVDGKVVASEQLQVTAGLYNKQINLEGLAKGMYYIKLDNGQDSRMDKIVLH